MTFISKIKEPKVKEELHDKVNYVSWNYGVDDNGNKTHLVRFENGHGKVLTTEEVKKVFPNHFAKPRKDLIKCLYNRR